MGVQDRRRKPGIEVGAVGVENRPRLVAEISVAL
jgi:hypothetical protein